MERKEIIDGLKDLIKDRESFITEGEPESWKTDTDKIFEHDKQVLEEAINTIQAQQQEIELLKIARDNWKKTAKIWDKVLKQAREALGQASYTEELIPHRGDIREWQYKNIVYSAIQAIDELEGLKCPVR